MYRLVLGVLILLSASPVRAAAQDSRPNVLLILADDLGYGDLSCFGAKDLNTPNVDRIAREGTKWTEFYANSSVCSPTRAALLSGRYQELVGVPGVIRTRASDSWGYLHPDAKLAPAYLRAEGYHTALVGKWHLGLKAPNRPNDRGFHHFHGFLGDMMDDYYKHRRHGTNYMRLDTEEVDPPGHATDIFSEWAVDYLESRRGLNAPFFLYLPYNAPHTPIQPPKDWLAKVRARHPDMPLKRANLVALIEHMDHGIGKVLKALEEFGHADNTLVIFTSDNGGQVNVGGLNGPLRDGKQSMYEGGLKVPLVASWPGKIAKGSTSQRRGITMDLLPTVLEAAGAELPSGLDGISQLSALRGTTAKPLTRDLFFGRREGNPRYGGLTTFALRRGDWKLVRNTPWTGLELFNLATDPKESTNLANSELEIFRELQAAMRLQVQRYGAVPWQP